MSPKSVFILLFSLNLLNYIDRQILFSVFPLIKTDLNLSDAQLGVLASAFMFVYMIAAPFVGFIADRTPRQYVVSVCAFLWSAATMLSGSAKNYFHLFAARSFIGIGEAGFTSVSPSFLAERFPPERRARVLAAFGLALPAGSALGYLLGGFLGLHFGWRSAFFIVGLPGAFAAAYAAFKLKDERTANKKQEKPKLANYSALLKNKPFLFVCLAQAMGTFTLGGLAAWMPTYMHRYYDFSVAQAGTVFGALTITAGAAGTFLGGFMADKLLKKTKKAYYFVSAASFTAALPFGFAAVICGDFKISLVLFAAAIMLVFMQTGPLNAAIVNLTDVKIRSMAFAVNIFIIHALGDAISPALVGGASYMFSLKTAVAAAMLFVLPAALFCAAASKADNAAKNGV